MKSKPVGIRQLIDEPSRDCFPEEINEWAAHRKDELDQIMEKIDDFVELIRKS